MSVFVLYKVSALWHLRTGSPTSNKNMKIINTLPKLINDDGILATAHELIPDDLRTSFTNPDGEPDNAILIYDRPSGDVDTIKWPHPNKDHLRGALYAARETGFIPNVEAVLLPDGEEFLID